MFNIKVIISYYPYTNNIYNHINIYIYIYIYIYIITNILIINNN